MACGLPSCIDRIKCFPTLWSCVYETARKKHLDPKTNRIGKERCDLLRLGFNALPICSTGLDWRVS
ncbi:hypothetical protein SADUNF_Sadunf09G0127400 [Salix dunnii]|uniref:Uncharacterized protein n=1 Tax=Salix dunnii TaxID=1413687 RepID=A0A835JW72_9ROSI|nr:hypothetical protein SADUNF_Sadunf09G0127400 [Salix dunnii]